MKLSGLKDAIQRWFTHRHQWVAFCLLLGFCFSCLPNLFFGQGVAAMQSQTVLEQGVSRAIARNPVEAEQRGNAAYQAGAYELAAQLWQQAAQSYQQQAEVAGQTRSLSNLSLAHQALGQWPQAEQAIAQALRLAQQLTPRSPSILAQIFNTQGQLQLALGQSAAALASWKQAETAYAQANDDPGLIRSQLNQIQALRNLGFYRRALDQMEEMEPAIQALADVPLKAIALGQAGELLRLAGDTTQAKVLLEQSLAISERLGLKDQSAQALMNLGALAHTRREAEEALSYYDRALAAATRPNRPQISLAKLTLLLQQEDLDSAQSLWPQLETDLGLLPINHSSIYQRINLAAQLMTLKELEQSSQNALEKALNKAASKSPGWSNIEALLNSSLSQARTIQDQRAESYALGILGEAYYIQERLGEAVARTNEALQLAQRLSAQDIAYRWQWNLSQMQMQQGHIESALDNCGEAVAMLQGLQSDLVALNPDIMFSFKSDIEPIYRGYADMLIQANDKAQDKQQNLRQVQDVSQNYLAQAEAAARGLRLSEVTHFLGENCAPSNAQPINIGTIDPSAAVIYPMLFEDRLEVLLNLPDQSFKHFTTSVPRTEVEKLAKQLRYYLVVRSSRRYLKLSQQLYDWLLRPLEAELEAQGIETLVFSLDGVLQGIPMAALYDGQQFLIENYQVALTPSLELFDPKPLDTENLSVLAAGLSESRQGFTPLPFVEAEIDNIQQRISGTTALLDEEFTSAALQARVQTTNAPVVHIATHGQFGSRPEETFLLAWDQSVNVKQIDKLLQRRSSQAKQAIELLVLSACETAEGDDQAMLGLAGLSIKAGARSTLATLWSVNDAGTSELMQNFYEALSEPGMSRAKALQQAQQAMLKERVYRHPLYWASYVMVGNWL